MLGDYAEYCRLFLSPSAVPATTPIWPWAPTFISFHYVDREEEHLALTPCSTQLDLHITQWGPAGVFRLLLLYFPFNLLVSYVLMPAISLQVPVDVVQGWLQAFQSAKALVQRQCSRILEV